MAGSCDPTPTPSPRLVLPSTSVPRWGWDCCQYLNTGPAPLTSPVLCAFVKGGPWDPGPTVGQGFPAGLGSPVKCAGVRGLCHELFHQRPQQ